ncbi:UNVERIFIED_CONTAM: hypothetical protein K2H54_025266 [Gekko kuhli]
MEPRDNPEIFPHTFERVAQATGWNPGHWALILTPYLMGPTQELADSLSVTSAVDYTKVSFKQIGLNLVRPVERSTGSHTHIRVLMDYAMHYLEANPLCSTTVEGIARKDFLSEDAVVIGSITAPSPFY